MEKGPRGSPGATGAAPKLPKRHECVLLGDGPLPVDASLLPQSQILIFMATGASEERIWLPACYLPAPAESAPHPFLSQPASGATH